MGYTHALALVHVKLCSVRIKCSILILIGVFALNKTKYSSSSVGSVAW